MIGPGRAWILAGETMSAELQHKLRTYIEAVISEDALIASRDLARLLAAHDYEKQRADAGFQICANIAGNLRRDDFNLLTRGQLEFKLQTIRSLVKPEEM